MAQALLVALAGAAKLHTWAPGLQYLANTAWAFAFLDLVDWALFVAVAGTAERPAWALNSRHLAFTAWASTTLDQGVDHCSG